MASPGVYFNAADEEWKVVNGSHHTNPAYYDALWAIQQAAYHFDEILYEPEFDISDEGNLQEGSTGLFFINEDGYLIKGTAADGKLASLYPGEKPADDLLCAVVHFESLLPLIGELPMETTEIW